MIRLFCKYFCFTEINDAVSLTFINFDKKIYTVFSVSLSSCVCVCKIYGVPYWLCCLHICLCFLHLHSFLIPLDLSCTETGFLNLLLLLFFLKNLSLLSLLLYNSGGCVTWWVNIPKCYIFIVNLGFYHQNIFFIMFDAF